MRFASGFVLVCVLPLVGVLSTSVAQERNDGGKAPPEAVAKWRQLRFGLFIHWGPVSLKGTEIGHSRGLQVPIEEYDNLYKRFNPVKFDADEWVKIAKDAGVKYIVHITKHHDGFCMFDTKQTDYNIMHTPFGRDIIKELACACRRQQMPLGLYYSVCDWWHPDFPLGSPKGRTRKPHPNLDRYEQYMCRQLDELCRNYGPLLTMWFDYPQEVQRPARPPRNAVGPVAAARHPDQQSPRLAHGAHIPADYDTPEQKVGPMQTDRPWETCMTLCQQWAWKPNDRMKSLKECLHVLVNTAGGDGNLLLNVGPMPDGRIEPRQAERLREIGRWLAKYGQSIYGTRGGPFQRGPWGAATCKDDTVYLHVLDPNLDSIKLPPLARKIVGSSVLTGGTATVKQSDDSIQVSVPKADRQDIDTIVALTLEDRAQEAKK